MILLDSSRDISSLQPPFNNARSFIACCTGNSGSTPSRDSRRANQVPPDGEGGRLVAFKLTSSPLRVEHLERLAIPESILLCTSIFRAPFGDESAAIPKAASPACLPATHTSRVYLTRHSRFLGRLRKPSQFKCESTAILWPAPNSRYPIKARQDGKSRR